MTVTWEFRRQSIVCSEALLRILAQALALHGDDLESTVIYLAIACGTVGGVMRDPRWAADPPPMGRLPPEQYGSVSRRQIAASTGLPRETVRRKIAALLARGDLVAVGRRVRVRSGVLEDSRTFEFAQTLVREFARTGQQVVEIATPRPGAGPGDPDRVAPD